MLIKACLNGGTTRAVHPSVPQTPGELAADASAAVGAGAGAVHLHPRDASGAETLDADAVLAAVAAVRAAVPATPVGVTTGLWAAAGDPARRMTLVSQWTGSVIPDFASVNVSEPGADDLARLLDELGIAVEAGIWSADDADRLAAGAFGRRVSRILIEPQAPRAAGRGRGRGGRREGAGPARLHGAAPTSRLWRRDLARAACRDTPGPGHPNRPGGHRSTRGWPACQRKQRAGPGRRAPGRRGPLAAGWPDRLRGGSLYAAGDASIPAGTCHARPRRLEA